MYSEDLRLTTYRESTAKKDQFIKRKLQMFYTFGANFNDMNLFYTILSLYIRKQKMEVKMKDRRIFKRGFVYYANLGYNYGSKQSGYRPVLVLQNNIGNRYSNTLIVAPITTRDKKLLPTHVYVGDKYGLDNDSIVLTEQITTIDKSRVFEYICYIDSNTMKMVEKALMTSLGITSHTCEILYNSNIELYNKRINQ